MTEPDRNQRVHVIEISFDDINERNRALDAIEKLLGEMGQIDGVFAGSAGSSF